MNMSVLQTKIDTHSEDFLQRQDRLQELINELATKLSISQQGGSWMAREQHIKRGKLLARERIAALLDVGSFFMELSPLAGEGVYDCDLPAAGLITGVGKIHGRRVMLIVNDATVKGGTYYPITVKKHLRAQEVAAENKLPCVHLVDSGGAFLPLQDQVFPDKEGFGRIFYNQARMSSEGIAQIAVVMGPCIAGGAYVAAMSDETIMVKKQGTIYLGGPELVFAATGEHIDPETLGGAEVHCKVSGVADYLADNDSHALELCRDLIKSLADDSVVEKKIFVEPVCNINDLYGIIPTDIRQPMDVHEIICRIVDASEFQEFKALYGMTLVCGFARIHGFRVGIIANNGILFSESALKGTHFIELCNQRGIPLVFLQNIAGFMVGKHYEHGGISKDGAKMVTAVATSSVAKFTVIIGGSFGAGNYAMCGRAYGARFLWIWPNSKISVMGGEIAASLMAQIRQQKQAQSGRWTDQQRQQLENEIISQFETQGSPYYSTARLWDDAIINPLHTRRYLAAALAMSKANEFELTNRQAIYRM